MQQEHREHVRRYQAKQAEARQQKTKEQEDEEMQTFWERLDELELEEELNEEEQSYKTKTSKKAPRVPESTRKGFSKSSTTSTPEHAPKTEPTKETKSAMKSPTAFQKKSDRQVSFNSTPQIQELKPTLDSDDYSEDELDQIVPTKSVGGVKDTVVERVHPVVMSSSATPVNIPAPLAPTSSAQPGPSEEPTSGKKVSLFNQRRGK